MRRRLVPDVIKECQCETIDPNRSVRDASFIMAERNIGALIVVSSESIDGIITERDLMCKVLAAGLDPQTTLVSEIMTPNPDTVGPDCTASKALEMMVTKGYRHLPIVNEEMVPIGMVSVRDLYEAVQVSLEEDLQKCELYVHGGESYGIGH